MEAHRAFSPQEVRTALGIGQQLAANEPSIFSHRVLFSPLESLRFTSTWGFAELRLRTECLQSSYRPWEGIKRAMEDEDRLLVVIVLYVLPSRR